MKKYLLFSDGKSPHTIKWLKELIKYFDIYLVSLNGVDETVYKIVDPKKVYILNKKIKRVDGGNYEMIFKLFALKKLLDKLKPDIVNAHYLSSYGLLASLAKSNRSFKLVHSTWGSDVLETPFLSKVRFYLAKYSFSKADLVTSDSYYMSDRIKEIYKKAPVETFSFGLDCLSDKKDIKKDDYLIFSNRALTHNYNIQKILGWFKTLDKRYKLIIANDGYLKKDIEAFIKKNDLLDRVKLVGFLSADEQIKIYKKARYYISIPTFDSSSVSLLEAMYFECFPIVSNIPANREWILDGINGIFFKKGSKLAFYSGYEAINEKIIQQNGYFPDNIKRYIKTLESI